MVIIVGDSRVYRFDNSTVICDIYDGYAEILVLPERRKFVKHLSEWIRSAHPERTPQYILGTIIANALKDGYLQVDEEVE